MDFGFKLISEEKESNVSNDGWDVIILGLGPASFTAGIYSLRYNLKTLLIGEEVGGLMVENPIIENYPGMGLIDGAVLSEKFKNHYNELKGQYKKAKIIALSKNKQGLFEVVVDSGEVFTAKSVIYSLGTKRRELGVIGEKKLYGKGVTYCATCDAPFTKDKTAIVIGGGDSAFVSALHISQFAKKVYLVHRREEFRAKPTLVKRAKEKGVEFILNSTIESFEGEHKLESVNIINTKTKIKRNIEGAYAFIEIGHLPSTELTKGLGVELDEKNFIKVDNSMNTNIEGFFAAGDCTNSSNHMAQIITACSEGALASESVYKKINNI